MRVTFRTVPVPFARFAMKKPLFFFGPACYNKHAERLIRHWELCIRPPRYSQYLGGYFLFFLHGLLLITWDFCKFSNSLVGNFPALSIKIAEQSIKPCAVFASEKRL